MRLVSRNVICSVCAILLCAQIPGNTLTASPSSEPAATAQAAPAAAVQPKVHVLQDGTPVRLRLINSLSSSNAKTGSEVLFEAVDDLVVDGVTVLTRGTKAVGMVTEAESRKRMGRAGKLGLTISSAQLLDGEKVALRASQSGKGDSREAGMVGLMLALPGVSAPFMLLIKGEDTTIPAGTHLNAFVDGDMKLDLEKFGVPEIPAEKQPATSGLPRSTLTIDSSPEGAQIALDGKSTYRTPATFTISQSVHQITLSRDGYLIWTASVDLTGKSAFHVAAELIKPQPDPGPAH